MFKNSQSEIHEPRYVNSEVLCFTTISLLSIAEASLKSLVIVLSQSEKVWPNSAVPPPPHAAVFVYLIHKMSDYVFWMSSSFSLVVFVL